MIDKRDPERVRHPTIDSILKNKYQMEISQEDLDKIMNWILLADDKDYPITNYLEIQMNRFVKQFKLLIIPFSEISSVLVFSEVEGPIVKMKGTEIELLQKGTLTDDLREILKYVHQQNNAGNNPTYAEVCRSLDFSKPTCRKKIRILIRFGYLLEVHIGQKKNLVITDIGKKCFT